MRRGTRNLRTYLLTEDGLPIESSVLYLRKSREENPVFVVRTTESGQGLGEGLNPFASPL